MKARFHRSPLLLLLLLLTFLASSLAAEVRLWRDQETDTAIDAELVKVEGDKITLRMPNGKSFTYAVARFHAEDQTYVKDWVAEQADSPDEKQAGEAEITAPAEVRRALLVSVKEESEAGTTERTGAKGSKGKTKTENTHFSLILSNARSGPPMKNLTVDYTIYKRKRTSDTKNKEGNRTLFEKESATEQVASILPGTASTLKTKSVATVDSTTPYKEKKKSYEKRLSEEVVGILVKVSIDGATVTTVEQPPGLLRTVEKSE